MIMTGEKFITAPAEIEAESMRIIERELAAAHKSFPQQLEAAIVKRVIHATADFDFADNLVFTKDFAEKEEAAIVNLVTDTNMILTGLSKPAMQKLGIHAVCYMGEPEIAVQAKERGVTRAVMSMEHAAELFRDGVYVIGNAPTALIRVAELADAGVICPRLVVGVPVGFVNVVESKEFALTVFENHHIPAVMAMGRKGGSTVAVAIVNAILYAAAGLQEPGKRM